MQKSVIYRTKNLEINFLKINKYRKTRDHSHYAGEYRGAAHSICNLKYSVPTKIPLVFHNESNYDYHFIIKELAEEFKKQFTCLGKNSEKYITFTVAIEKACSSQILSIIFLKEFKELNVNTDMIIKNVKLRIRYKYCRYFLEYTNFKDNLIEYKCLCCNKNY